MSDIERLEARLERWQAEQTRMMHEVLQRLARVETQVQAQAERPRAGLPGAVWETVRLLAAAIAGLVAGTLNK